MYTTVQKFGVSKFLLFIYLFFKEIKTFIQQGCVKLRSDSKDLYC